MPFKSKAQRRFFYAAESRGELPRGTARRWEKETPKGKKLPEKVKQAAFDQGVRDGMAKVAQRSGRETAEQAAFGAGAGLAAGGIGQVAVGPFQDLLGYSLDKNPSSIRVTDAYMQNLRRKVGVPESQVGHIFSEDGSPLKDAVFGFDTKGRRVVRAPRQGAEFMAHELGHAARATGKSDRAVRFGGRIRNQILPLAGAAVGGAMAIGGEEGGLTTRLAPVVTAASFAPQLIEEAGASLRGYKALKSLSNDTKALRQARRNLYKAFGTYGLRALGTTVAIGAISAYRWNKPQGAPDKGKKGPN